MEYLAETGNGDLESTSLAPLRPKHRTETWMPYRNIDQRLQGGGNGAALQDFADEALGETNFLLDITQSVGLGRRAGVPDCPIGSGQRY